MRPGLRAKVKTMLLMESLHTLMSKLMKIHARDSRKIYQQNLPKIRHPQTLSQNPSQNPNVKI